MERAVGEYWLWAEDDRVTVRLRTNLGRDELSARIAERGLWASVKALDGYPDVTRLRGGTSYLIVWNDGVGIDTVREFVSRL